MFCSHLVASFTGVSASTYISQSKDVLLLLLPVMMFLLIFLTLCLHIGSHIMNAITQANTTFSVEYPHGQWVLGVYGLRDAELPQGV